ncbi:WASH complex subunit 4 [Tetranychus urticae]|uniref:WASH complex subunit 4 n=1 Tax=Tetranychus urticae TaxID=32264 RepID=T1JVL8_TETUR|nr:WASH complex subunit 4 [Tetranychus urticae]
MAAKEVLGSLINELTDSVLLKYGSFLNEFDSKLEELHKVNLQYTYSSIVYGSYFNPGLDETVHERTEFVDILRTCGNMELNRVLLVLSSLCHEMNNLSQIGLKDFIHIIALYGEDKKKADWKNDTTKAKESNDEAGDELFSMSKLLPTLFKLLCFIKRCREVVHNLAIQMQELFTRNNGKKVNSRSGIEVNDVRFDALFQHLGQLAVTIVNIEEILCSQTSLRKDFINFKRTFEIVIAKYDDFQLQAYDHQKMKVLHSLTVQIEKEIIDGNLFSQIIDAIKSTSSESSPDQLIICDHLALYIKNAVQFHEGNTNPIKDDKKWLAINALLAIYVRTSKREDRKLIKMVFDSQKKINALYIHLKGNCTIFPDKFLNKQLLKSRVDKKMIEYFKQTRESTLKIDLTEKVKSLNIKVNLWMLKFDDLLSEIEETTNDFIEILHKQIKVIEEGLDLALQCSSIGKNHIYQHNYAKKSLCKSDLIAVCKLTAILKGIELSFLRRKGEILQILARSTQYYSYLILGALTSCKKRLISEVKKYSEKKLDVLSAIILGSNCIHGPILTLERQILASLCFSIANQSMNENELAKVYSGFKRIRSYCLIFKRLQDWTSCEFIFFNRSLIGNYFNHSINHELNNIFELRYFFQSFAEFVPMVENGFLYDEKRRDGLLKDLETEIYYHFKANYLEKLCSLMEEQLRREVAGNSLIESTTNDANNPFKNPSPNLSVIISCEPLRILTRMISIKEHVEQYLNEMAYNNTTNALHECKTYETMLNLARHKYRLELLESQLPTQTLEQGLDVLEVTRNIHIFVSRYLYNLNNQMFIEKSSENMHLNVLLIRHVANSIQTHGFGIINTAVNFTYQFLKRKLYSFSQFLYEDPLKSRLIKDLKHFRQSKDGRFPYERAENLVKGIRKLGLTPEGYTLLDRFRLLITEIGNALGFVRMLRSGALHCSSSSVSFVPDLEELNTISFKSMVLEDGFGSECLKSAQNLDHILQTLSRNFSEATDYYNLLVQVFQETLKGKDNFHLKKFYVILPALTLNYVENSIISKEKMTRKNKTGAAFTDDGFPMGVAYILKLLDQHYDFDTLQWFASVNEKIKMEMNQALSARSVNSTNLMTEDKLSQTLKLTEKRLDMLQKEFNLLNYSLTSSRILFKATNQEARD